MPRQVRMLVVTPYGTPVSLEDGEVARVIKAEYVKQTQYQPNYHMTASGTSPQYQVTGESGHWEVLIVTGPPETADEIAKAVERTLRSAP